MAVKITDIAREAGVSISTVSRVMNGTKAVSPELRNRVYKVIDEHHYSPNVLAQSLITKRTNIVGVIVPDISNAVFGALTKGVNHLCSKKGYTIMMCESGGKLEIELKLLDVLEDRHIDGVLFCGVDVNRRLVDAMQQKDYPVVLMTQEASIEEISIDTVVHDNVRLMYDSIMFLHANGHKRIAYLGGPAYDISSGKKRLKGYKKAMEELGLKISDSYIQEVDFSFNGGYEGAKIIYEESSLLPTAIAAGSDQIALGCAHFLNSHGIRVPEDMSVIGIDDLEYATYFQPALTTVRIPYFEEGAMAAERLMDCLEGSKSGPNIQYVKHKIIRRGTVKAI